MSAAFQISDLARAGSAARWSRAPKRKAPKGPGWITAEDAARILGISPATLLTWRRDGRSPPFTVGRDRIAYRRDAVIETAILAFPPVRVGRRGFGLPELPGVEVEDVRAAMARMVEKGRLRVVEPGLWAFPKEADK